jgi:flagellar FliL protein
MSTAAAADAPPPAKGQKKLIIIIIAAVLVLAIGGVAAMLQLKKKQVDPDAEGDEPVAAAKAAPKHDPKAVPAFVPLEAFTVNLADRNAERFAQIGVTLELEDAHMADQIKNYMPAIRNNILMAIADRTAAELMDREGKAKLAERIRKETSKVLGFEVEEEDADADSEKAADDHGDKPDKSEKKPKKKKKKKAAHAELPIKAVHFSNFILQ